MAPKVVDLWGFFMVQFPRGNNLRQALEYDIMVHFGQYGVLSYMGGVVRAIEHD
ncbi:MAG: hypothetical protein AAFX53_03560 [Bacteroidota bacterium]